MFDIDVSKSLPTFSLRIAATSDARVLGIVGPSGCGKTTLLNCVAGIADPDRGRITLDSRTLFDSSQSGLRVPIADRGVGFVFQDGLLFPHMTVEANLRYGFHAHGPGPGFRDVVDILELGQLLSQRADTLSGGETRRVAIGRALMSAPRVLLLDEPLTGLDRRLARITLAYLQRVLEAFELPAMYVSHSISDVLLLCEEAWLITDGELVTQGSPRAILMHSAAAETFATRHLENVFMARPAETTREEFTTFLVGDQPLVVSGAGSASGSEAMLSIYGTDIILARKKPELISARNVLRGRITDVTAAGQRMLVGVDVGADWIVQLTQSAIDELDLKPGADVYAIVKASAISVAEPRVRAPAPT